MIKDILINIGADPNRDPARDYAMSVARLFEAHLSGVAFAVEPGIPGTMFDSAAIEVFSQCRDQNRKAARAAQAKFEDTARQAGVLAETRMIEASIPDIVVKFDQLARCHDLTIVGQAQPGRELPEELLIETALFGSGRPVLIVPYIQQTGIKTDRIMVCWDGSRNAARAVADAMPLLKRAGAIDVVTIEHRERRNELVGADIAQHLARHGLKVDLNPIVAGDTDVPNTILSHAADAGTDLIVMGGYGHSRLREFVLGGATRGILGSMTVPTLMSH